MQHLREIFVLPTGHKRCTGCNDVLLNMTGNHILACSDEALSDIDRNLLPIDFDLGTLPDSICPDCEVYIKGGKLDDSH